MVRKRRNENIGGERREKRGKQRPEEEVGMIGRKISVGKKLRGEGTTKNDKMGGKQKGDGERGEE